MSVANSYARALYEAAVEAKTGVEGLDQIEAQLEAIAAALSAAPAAGAALFGPLTNAKEKLSFIQELGQKAQLSPLVSNFLVLLANKGRLGLFTQVRSAFRSARLLAEGGVAGQLVAADPVSDADLRSLSDAFSRKLGKKVTFRVSTDPSLLAGMKVTVSGVTYDGTLRSQLQRLRDRVALGVPQG